MTAIQQPHPLRWAMVAAPILVAAAAVVALSRVVAEPIRLLEGKLVAVIASAVSSNVHDVGIPAGAFVEASDGTTFGVKVAPSCSAIAVLTLLGVLAVLLRGVPASQRLVAFAAGAVVVVAANVLRVVVIVVAGAHHGRHTMYAVHDWFGTPVTWLGGVAGLVVLVRVAHGELPSIRGSSGRRPVGSHAR